MPDIDVDAPGTTLLLMGNEAIVRGALEAGVGFASSYPGTPASEILPTVASVAKKRGIYAEWAVNEMLALESATAAALAGIRSMASMKAQGVNVCSDFLGNLVARGTVAGLVLIDCDDPSGRNSSAEQDLRPIAKWFDIPLLEPANQQEAKDMTKYLFDLSEEVDSICMLRSVHKISHTRSAVTLGEIPKKEHKAHFTYDLRERQNRYGLQGERWAVSHAIQHQNLAKAQVKFESSPFNQYTGPDNPELLIIACGTGLFYSQEAVRELKLDNKVGILKLGTVWPIPEKFIEKHLRKASKILFVEEIDPFVEQSVMELTASLPPDGPRPVFYGKRSKHIDAFGEVNPDMVVKAICSIMGISYQLRDSEYSQKIDEIVKEYLIPRSGTLCPGCPHKASQWILKNALVLDGRDGFCASDIGCYTGAGTQGIPLIDGKFLARTHYCMGAGAGIANGLGKLGRFGFNQPVLGFTGDSTFFHATIPALVDAVYNNSNFILIVFDNSTTGMTGFQPHAGTGRNAMGEPSRRVSIEAVCRAIGLRVEIGDPFDLQNTQAKLLDLINGEGPRVMIMRRECELMRARREEAPYRMYIDPEKCLGADCGCDQYCYRVFNCLGLIWNKETGKSEIDEVTCAGCGFCADICPHGAIIRVPLRTEKAEAKKEIAV